MATLVGTAASQARIPAGPLARLLQLVTRTHGDKPLMIAEWGVFEYPSDPARKAWIFSTVAAQLSRYPGDQGTGLRRLPGDPKGDTRPDSSPPALAEYRRLAESRLFRDRLTDHDATRAATSRAYHAGS